MGKLSKDKSKRVIDGNVVLDRDWHWAYNLIPIGLIFGFVSMAYLVPKTLMPVIEMLRIVVVCLFAGLVIPQKFYRKYLVMGPWATVLLNVLGVGPILVALLGWGNYLLADEAIPMRWKIHQYKVHTEQADYLESAYVEVVIDDPNTRKFPALAHFENHEFDPEATHVRMEVATGYFGVRVLKSRELVR